VLSNVGVHELAQHLSSRFVLRPACSDKTIPQIALNPYT
jgi:hypothetical protein